MKKNRSLYYRLISFIVSVMSLIVSSLAYKVEMKYTYIGFFVLGAVLLIGNMGYCCVKFYRDLVGD